MPADIAKVVLTPYTAALLCLAVALVVSRQRAVSATLLGLGLLLLLVFSLPVTSSALLFSLEKRYPPRAPGEYPTTDIIAVMGGGVSHNGSRATLARSGDRMLLTFLLHQNNPTSTIWLAHNDRHADTPTTRPMNPADLLQSWGVSEDRIVSLAPVKNTQSEVLLIADRYRAEQGNTMTVVTSATHMLRVEAQLKHAGIDVVTAAANHWITPARRPLQLTDFLPSAISLGGSTRALNEYLAYGVCKVRRQC